MIPALLTPAPWIGALCARTLHVTESTFPVPVPVDTLLDGGDLKPVDVILPLQVLVLELDHVLTRGVPHARVVSRRGRVSVDVHLSENAGRIGERPPSHLPPIRIGSEALGKAELTGQRPGHLSLVRSPLRFSLREPVYTFEAENRKCLTTRRSTYRLRQSDSVSLSALVAL